MVWWYHGRRGTDRQPRREVCTRFLDGTAHSLREVKVKVGEAQSLDGGERWGWCVEWRREV